MTLNTNHLPNIILDFGGVLMQHDRQGCLQAFRQLMSDDAISRVLGLGNNKPDTLRMLLETGQISQQLFVSRVLALCRPGTTERQVIEAWNKMHAGIPTDIWQQLNSLKKEGYHLYLLSNTDAIHWQHTMALYHDEFAACFERLFLSFEMGACKPEPEIYRTVATYLSADSLTDGERRLTWFVDDTLVNRHAADRSVGWLTCASLDELLENLRT